MTPVVGLSASDLAHGVVEGEAEGLDVEVNGVTGEIALRPAPVAVFDDEAGIGGQNEIAITATNQSAVVSSATKSHARCFMRANGICHRNSSAQRSRPEDRKA